MSENRYFGDEQTTESERIAYELMGHGTRFYAATLIARNVDQVVARAEAAEARAAELEAECREWHSAFVAADEMYRTARTERDTAQRELQQIRDMLDDGGNGNSNTALDLVTRLQAAYAALWREAWIER